MLPLSFPARVNSAIQNAVPNRFENVHNSMVHYPVRIKRQNEYFPFFRLIYDFCSIWGSPIIAAQKELMQIIDIMIQIAFYPLDYAHSACGLLPPLLCFMKCQLQIILIYHTVVQISVSSHLSPSRSSKKYAQAASAFATNR